MSFYMIDAFAKLMSIKPVVKFVYVLTYSTYIYVREITHSRSEIYICKRDNTFKVRDIYIYVRERYIYL